MKKLLLLWIFSGSLDGFSQVPDTAYLRKFDPERWGVIPAATYDTIPESMHVSTRKKGFVFSQVALSVRRNGYCIGHLDCNRKPFPVHYTVGWCQGKDEVYKAIVEVLNNKPTRKR
jgi:hypothetical protein